MGDSPLSDTICDNANAQTATPDTVEAVLPDPTPGFLSRYALNPLVGAAHPLLELAMRLRQNDRIFRLEDLRARVQERVQSFFNDGARAGIDAETLATASYCLCTFLDEVIAGKSWGEGGAWSAQSLLISFHGEASGGERFFAVADRLSQDPSANIDMLELISIIMALGMEGRYRLAENGSLKLERVRESLRSLIASHRIAPVRALSLRWQRPVRLRRRKWQVNMLSASVVGSLVALTLLFISLDYRLWVRTTPIVKELGQIRVVTRLTPIDTVSPVDSVSNIVGLLAPELAAHSISVKAKAGRVVITLCDGNVFASGSTQVLAQYVPLFRRIGNALREVSGRVVVIGYADDRPPSPGARSNWQLSYARASQVVELLRTEAGHPERFLGQGRGDLEPVVPNDSGPNEARNRRVVIVLLPPGDES